MIRPILFIIAGLMHTIPSFSGEGFLIPPDSPFSSNDYLHEHDRQPLFSGISELMHSQATGIHPVISSSSAESTEDSSEESYTECSSSDYECQTDTIETLTDRINRLEEEAVKQSRLLKSAVKSLKTLAAAHKKNLKELRSIREEYSFFDLGRELFAGQKQLVEHFERRLSILDQQHTRTLQSSSSKSLPQASCSPASAASSSRSITKSNKSSSSDSTYCDDTDEIINIEDNSSDDDSPSVDSSAPKSWNTFQKGLCGIKPTTALKKLNEYILVCKNENPQNLQTLHQAYARRATVSLKLYKDGNLSVLSLQASFDSVIIEHLHPLAKKSYERSLHEFEELKNSGNKRQRVD